MHMGNVPRRALYGHPELTVFNSELLRDQYAWIAQGLVVHPPIREAGYLSTRGRAITLVNLTEPKGADVFYSLVRQLPDHQFLGVKGTGAQLVPGTIPENLTVLEQVADMREVYGRTRVLLMPSVYESYGRVALEAAVSGIPTIAHPAAGVREAMGDAVLWADRADLNQWTGAIRRLDDPVEYETRSLLARARFEQLDSGGEIDQLERALLGLRKTRTR
jgi:glycosyltransferase involved in cell wall biosynthesis